MELRDNNIDVLIVGAGPSGLMMACQLALHNISFRIIDKKNSRTNYSGALIIQARTLEIFQQMGIAQSTIENGIIANGIKLIFHGEKILTIPVGDIGQGLSVFPYLLLHEQSKTEQLLTDFIRNYGFDIERETELLQFIQDSGSVTSIIQHVIGEEETITSKYLIAADGAHSTVRKQLQIPFEGEAYPISLFVTDCQAKVDFPSDHLCFSFSDNTTTGFFPLQNERWRVDSTVSKEMENKDPLNFDDIEKGFGDRTRMNVKIYDPEWFSVFQVNERVASSYHQNRCFLVGDAAHIHSPVGAQGMNTGLQDSYNLAWKLALVILKKAKTTLLDSYSTERIVVAQKVVNGTKRAFNFVTSRNFFTKTFRVRILPTILQFVLPLLIKQKVIRHFFFRRISQIGVQYRKSSFSHQTSQGKFPRLTPKPGERIPYYTYNENGSAINIQDKVTGKTFHLFIFSKITSPDSIIRVVEKYSHLISMETIPFTFETSNLYKQFGIENYGCYLIRPDQYIAYRSCKPDAGHFENYLSLSDLSDSVTFNF